MKRLLQIEWMKVIRYKTFWIFSGLFTVLTFFTYYVFGDLLKGTQMDFSFLYRFPDVWYYSAYISSYFSPIIALLMITLVSNEFTFRTLRQQIIEGLSRNEVLIAKLLFAGFMSLGVSIIVFLSGLTIGLIKSTSDLSFSGFDYVFRAGWVCFGMMTAGTLIALLTRRSALAILFFILLLWIIEPLAGNIFLREIYAYFPLNSLDKFIASPISIQPEQIPAFGKIPTPPGVWIAGIAWPLVFIAGSFLLLRKRDF